MPTIINCFGLGSNVTTCLKNNIGSQYNLISHELSKSPLKCDLLNSKEYACNHAIALKKMYNTPIIIGINSIELCNKDGFPGALINTIKINKKLQEFSSVFKGEIGILRYGILFFITESEFYYFDKFIRGGIFGCASNTNIYKIFSPSNSAGHIESKCVYELTKTEEETYNIIKDPVLKVSDFLKNRYLLPINIIKASSQTPRLCRRTKVVYTEPYAPLEL